VKRSQELKLGMKIKDLSDQIRKNRLLKNELTREMKEKESEFESSDL
jgi:hypothetical protein